MSLEWKSKAGEGIQAFTLAEVDSSEQDFRPRKFF
jgi:hypothetical protein